MREVIEGKIQGNERGYAFLIPIEEGKEDYFIPHCDLKDAMHGDTVLAETTFGHGERTTARVLKVLNRGIDKLVGTYFSNRHGGIVAPDERKYFCDIFIPFGKGVRAKSGDKVVCKILSYPKRGNPEGIVTEILGRQFEKNAELKAIRFNYKLPEKFPKPVILEAEHVAKNYNGNDFSNRKDFTNIVTMTIDGADAKDFDDAVSIEKTTNGEYKLGVHIADVTNFVKFNGEIDKEAFNRATSVYFPESVVPMLPEVLCNDICSLKPYQERYTLSCVMNVDKTGRVTNYEITPAVIKSSARLTYNQVQSILDGDKETISAHEKVVSELALMNELADILIKRREIDGSIDLDVKESTIFVDKKGEIIVESAKRDKAHKIIEEFMVLANTTVAEYMYYLEKPFIYRIHEKPSQEKLKNFYDFLKGLGISVSGKKGDVYPKDFQAILERAEGTPTFTLINRVMLRSMQKARYSPIDLGHFGLSLKHYCHFTSPIRRYPDLVIHRIIKDFLSGKTDLEKKYKDFVFEASKQSSEKERNAIEAERDVDDYYKMLYISGYVGQEYEGVISGVMPFGLFVELNNCIEGLVKIETIKNKGKRFICDQKNYSLTNGKTVFKLGQKVKIKVAGVFVSEKRAEFVLAN